MAGLGAGILLQLSSELTPSLGKWASRHVSELTPSLGKASRRGWGWGRQPLS